MSSYNTIETPQDYVNYTFNITSRGITEVTGELAGLSNTVTTILGQLAFKTSEYLTHTESLMISMGAVSAASFASATKEAMKFEQAIANVQAIGGESINAMQIGQAAMQYSNQFGMDVNSMTEGLEALSRAGLSATNVMSGVLAEGVKLSKLEGMDLEDSINDLISSTNLLAETDIDVNSQEYANAVKAMNQHIVSTSESSPINAQNIMQSLQHVGGYVSSNKIDQDDLFAVIAQLGAKGTKGEMAGTALRAFVAAGQKDQAQRALSRIGLDVSDLWDESGEAMLPISEMKDVLDNALEARGYSKQEKLEFYADFVGYKQANQIMKIDSTEVQQYKETIAHAWDLGKKLDTILGTTHNNMQILFQTIKNFMTKVGQSTLPILNAIVTPIKWGVQLLDAMPFSENITGMILAFGTLKAILLIINRVVPSIASMYTSFSSGEEKAKGIAGHFKNMYNDLTKSYDILTHITDSKYLSKIRVAEGFMGQQSYKQHQYVTQEIYKLYTQDNPNADKWFELAPIERELFESLTEAMKDTEVYKNIEGKYKEKSQKEALNIITFMENPQRASVTYGDSKQDINKRISEKTQANNDAVNVSQQLKNEVRDFAQELNNSLIKKAETQEEKDITSAILNTKEALAEAIGRSVAQSFRTREVEVSKDLGSFEIDKRVASGAIKQLQEIETQVSNELGDIGYFLKDDIDAIDNLISTVRYDLQQKISAYSNTNPSYMNHVQEQRMEKGISRAAKTNLGLLYSSEQNNIDILNVLRNNKWNRPNDSRLGIRDAQMDAIEEALNMDSGAGKDRDTRLTKIHNELQAKYEGKEKEAKIAEILEKTEAIWLKAEKEKEVPSVVASRHLTDARAQHIGNAIGLGGFNWAQIDNAADVLTEYFKDAKTNPKKQQELKRADKMLFSFLEEAKGAGEVFNAAEVEELGYLIRRYKQLMAARVQAEEKANKSFDKSGEWMNPLSANVGPEQAYRENIKNGGGFYPNTDLSQFSWKDNFENFMQTAIINAFDAPVRNKWGISYGSEIEINPGYIKDTSQAFFSDTLNTLLHESAHSILQHQERYTNTASSLYIGHSDAEWRGSSSNIIAELEASMVANLAMQKMGIDVEKDQIRQQQELLKLWSKMGEPDGLLSFADLNHLADEMANHVNDFVEMTRTLMDVAESQEVLSNMQPSNVLTEKEKAKLADIENRFASIRKKRTGFATGPNFYYGDEPTTIDDYYISDSYDYDTPWADNQDEHMDEMQKKMERIEQFQKEKYSGSAHEPLQKDQIKKQECCEKLLHAVRVNRNHLMNIYDVVNDIYHHLVDNPTEVIINYFNTFNMYMKNMQEGILSLPSGIGETIKENNNLLATSAEKFYEDFIEAKAIIIEEAPILIDTAYIAVKQTNTDIQPTNKSTTELYRETHDPEQPTYDTPPLLPPSFLPAIRTINADNHVITLLDETTGSIEGRLVTLLSNFLQLGDAIDKSQEAMLEYMLALQQYAQIPVLALPPGSIHGYHNAYPEHPWAFPELPYDTLTPTRNLYTQRAVKEPYKITEQQLRGVGLHGLVPIWQKNLEKFTPYNSPIGPNPDNTDLGKYTQAQIIEEENKQLQKRKEAQAEADLQAREREKLIKITDRYNKKVQDNKKRLDEVARTRNQRIKNYRNERQELLKLGIGYQTATMLERKKEAQKNAEYNKHKEQYTPTNTMSGYYQYLNDVGYQQIQKEKQNDIINKRLLEEYNSIPQRPSTAKDIESILQEKIDERSRYAFAQLIADIRWNSRKNIVEKEYIQNGAIKIPTGNSRIIPSYNQPIGPITREDFIAQKIDTLFADNRYTLAFSKIAPELIDYVDKNFVTQDSGYIPTGVPTGLQQAGVIKQQQEEKLATLSPEEQGRIEILQFYANEKKLREEEHNAVLESENEKSKVAQEEYKRILEERDIRNNILNLDKVIQKAEEDIQKEKRKNIINEKLLIDELNRKFNTGLHNLTDEELALIGKEEYSINPNSKARADALQEKRRQREQNIMQQGQQYANQMSGLYDAEKVSDIDNEARQRKKIEENKHIAQQQISQYSAGYDAENIPDIDDYKYRTLRESKPEEVLQGDDFWREIERQEKEAMPSKVEQANAAVERYKKHQEALHKQMKYQLKQEIKAMDGLLIGFNEVAKEAEEASKRADNVMLQQEAQRQATIKRQERQKEINDFWTEQEQLEQQGIEETAMSNTNKMFNDLEEQVEYQKQFRILSKVNKDIEKNRAGYKVKNTAKDIRQFIDDAPSKGISFLGNLLGVSSKGMTHKDVKQEAEENDYLGKTSAKVTELNESLKPFNQALYQAGEIFPPFTIAAATMSKTMSALTMVAGALNFIEQLRLALLGEEYIAEEGSLAAKLLGIAATWAASNSEAALTGARIIGQIETWKTTISETVLGAVRAFINGPLLLPIIAILAAIAATLATLYFWEKQHANALKETQEQLQKATAENNIAASQYKDLKKAREAETDAIKRQQKARKEAIALYELEASRVKRRRLVHDEANLRNDALWGEYGLRAAMQKMGLGFIAGGDFESQYENYDGTTKNIRQIKEETVGNLFATSSQRQVASFYDNNSHFLAEVEAYKEPLQELYDKESKLIEKYGSIDAARGTKEFEEAVQEFADATGINGKTAGMMLDWLETENRVDKATTAMQTTADVIVAKANANAMKAMYPELETEGEGFSGVENAMIMAQAESIYKDAYDQMWWDAFGNRLWGYFNVLLAILDPLGIFGNHMEEAQKYFGAAEAYDEGMKELVDVGIHGLYEQGEEAAEAAERRDYGLGTYAIDYGDTPFGAAKEASAAAHADEQQRQAYANNGQVYSESEYLAIQDQYQQDTYGKTAQQQKQEAIQENERKRREKENQNQKSTENQNQEGTEKQNDTLSQLQSNQEVAHNDALNIIDAILGNPGAVSGAGAGVVSIAESSSPLFKSLRKRAVKDVFKFMEGGGDTLTEKIIDYSKPQIKNIQAAYADDGLRGVYNYGKNAIKGSRVYGGLSKGINAIKTEAAVTKGLYSRYGLEGLMMEGNWIKESVKDTQLFGKVSNVANNIKTIPGKVGGIRGLVSSVSSEVGGVRGLASSTVSGMTDILNPKTLAGGIDDIVKGARGGGTLMKGIGKVGGRALAFLGPALAFADKAAELNPFEGKHYNEDGTEKKALQATGEVVGTTVGALGGVAGGMAGAEAGAVLGATIGSVIPGVGTVIGGALGAVAGGIAGGWLGDTIFQPIGDAIGGTIGWLGDNLLSGIQDVAGNVWNGLTEAAGGVWEAVSGVASGVWDAVSGVASGVWDFITGANDESSKPVKGILGWTPIGMGINIASGINSWLTDSGMWDAVSGAATGVWNFITGANDESNKPIKGILGWTPIGMGINVAAGISDWLTGNGNQDKQVQYRDEAMKPAKSKHVPQDNSQTTVIIKNININTEDDPEKIKSALMNLIIEMQEQVSPRQVSRTVGEPPAVSTDASTDTNNQDQAEGQDEQNANGNTNTNTNNNPTT